MNNKNEKVGKSIGLFIIVLIISMPIYSADVLASSVQITTNAGEKGIEGAIDAEGDVWKVEALVSGVSATGAGGGGNSTDAQGSIDANDVKITIGQNVEVFNSCSSSPLGFLCTYLSPLTEGVKEGTYPFTVKYELFKDVNDKGKNPSATSDITADGSGPVITWINAPQQVGEQLKLNFKVEESGVGLGKIELLDAETGGVFFTESAFNADTKKVYEFGKDSGKGGLLPMPWTGEGIKKVKIQATDLLGHSSSQLAVGSVSLDLVKPVIDESSLEFENMGKFVGGVLLTKNMVVKVKEAKLKDGGVKAISDSVKLGNVVGECSAEGTEENVWKCRWMDVEVKPDESISVKFSAEDGSGNVVEKMITKSFTKDVSVPSVEFFGTLHTFNGKSYINTDEHTILLKVKEQGSGMSSEGVRANLVALGKTISDAADSCEQTETTFDCRWKVSLSTKSDGTLRMGLSKFKDNVGNEGKTPEYDVVVDTTGPKVEKMELYGNSEIGDKTYFQSGDKLKIKLRVAEQSGLAIFVNMNELVTDVETKFPETEYTKGKGFSESIGWQMFTEKDCKFDEDVKVWNCELLTSPLRSGPSSDVDVEIKVRDTAGNEAGEWSKEPVNVKSGAKGKYKIDILGLGTETNPDYWEVGSVKPIGKSGDIGPFVDLDTTPLMYARMPFDVGLKPHKNLKDSVQALKIEMIGTCQPKEGKAAVSFKPKAFKPGENGTTSVPTPEVEAGSTAPKVSRNLLYGGVTATTVGSAKPNVVLEFEPFDGRKMFTVEGYGKDFSKVDVKYMCTMRIYSKVGQAALQQPEMQEVEFIVPFAFSQTGALDENLGRQIETARKELDAWYYEIGKFQKYMKYLDYLSQIVTLYHSLIALYNEGAAVLDSIQGIPPAKPGQVATCVGFKMGGEVVTEKASSVIDQVVQVLSCRGGTELGWYGRWQMNILRIYNLEIGEAISRNPVTLSGEQLAMRPAHDIKENIYLSTAGLCIPGIIKNLNKLRQIKCRKIYCLKNEVKAGVATVESCQKLEDLLFCKYWVGELWYIIPFTQVYDKMVNSIYTAVKDPIALVHTANIAACALFCSASGTSAKICSYTSYFWKIVDEIESVIGFITTVQQEFSSGGAQYCDTIGEG